MTRAAPPTLAAWVDQASSAVAAASDPSEVAAALGGIDRGSPDLAPGLLIVRRPVDGAWQRLEVAGAGPDLFVVLTPRPGHTVGDLSATLGPGRRVPGSMGESWRWDRVFGGQPVAIFAELEVDGTVSSFTIRRDGI